MITKILTGLFSLMLLMVGADKFLNFLEPPCSLMDTLPSTVWSLLGVIQILGGLLVWSPKIKKPILVFFLFFMLGFTIYHLTQSTYDIGGSSFMAVLCGILLWDPSFMSGKKD